VDGELEYVCCEAIAGFNIGELSGKGSLDNLHN
jgi:hypothetical protein